MATKKPENLSFEQALEELLHQENYSKQSKKYQF